MLNPQWGNPSASNDEYSGWEWYYGLLVSSLLRLHFQADLSAQLSKPNALHLKCITRTLSRLLLLLRLEEVFFLDRTAMEMATVFPSPPLPDILDASTVSDVLVISDSTLILHPGRGKEGGVNFKDAFAKVLGHQSVRVSAIGGATLKELGEALVKEAKARKIPKFKSVVVVWSGNDLFTRGKFNANDNSELTEAIVRSFATLLKLRAESSFVLICGSARLWSANPQFDVVMEEASMYFHGFCVGTHSAVANLEPMEKADKWHFADSSDNAATLVGLVLDALTIALSMHTGIW
jgi:hypothetical protein